MLLLPLFAKTQFYSYKPFPDNQAVWVDLWEVDGGDPLMGIYNYESSCDIFIMQGDTLLADTTLWNALWVYSSSYDTLPEYYFGGLKEDSLQRIWLWMANETAPFLIYDFSLSIGDTFTLSIPGAQDLLALVIDDDSFDISGRTLSIAFDTSIVSSPPDEVYIDSYEPILWQEGKGSVNSGFMYFYNYLSDRTAVVSQTLVYFNPDSVIIGNEYVCKDTSYTIYNSIADPLCETLSYPNPGTNAALVKLCNAIPNTKLNVYDLHGRLVEYTYFSSNEVKLNTTDWQNGIFFIELLYGDKRKMLKWVKNE